MKLGNHFYKEKSLTRKICTITYAISRPRAAVVLHTHKSLRAHNSLTRKVVLYVHNKSLTRTRCTSYTYVTSSAQVVYVRNKSLTRKSRIFYAKPLTGRTSRTTYARRSLQAISTNQQDFSKKGSNPFFTFLFLSSLASWPAVNRASPHD